MGILPHKIKSARPGMLLAAATVTAALALAFFGPLPRPFCPFLEYFGFDCPMCGTTRAVLALAAGRWADAFRENPAWWLWTFWTLAAFADLWHRAFKSEGTIGQRLITSAMGSKLSKGGHAAAAVSMMVYRNFLR